MTNYYEFYKKYQVKDVKSVDEFLKKYTKYDRHEGRGKEYAENRLRVYTKEFLEEGYTYMSHFESVTGEVVSFYDIK
ncbi:hypothetical protein [Priestia aryabhattai]|uniref:hypothetical protein n=1 Tax=Priestia aryabhattai TaxID=412384 RepID=UPI0015F5F8D2|nr:hypothetical protein [Priestia aryabhattai]